MRASDSCDMPADMQTDARERSTRLHITEAAIRVLADRGLAGVSYRRVAAEAKVSLALVNYYFPSKFDVISAASSVILDRYVAGFARAAQRFRSGQTLRYRDFAYRLLRNASRRDRHLTLAWAEITLDAVRHGESLDLSRTWNEQIKRIWAEIAEAVGEPDPKAAARFGIDVVMGLLFLICALRLSETQIDAVLLEGESPLDRWAPEAEAHQPMPERKSSKAARTREAILAAAIGLLVSDGAAAISFRSVAAKAGLATAAPAYHFPTVDALLSAAQMSMIEDARQRYRAAMTNVDRDSISLEVLVDRTATTLIREATEFAPRNLAFYASWMEGARRPELRPVLWPYIGDNYLGWQRLFETLAGRPLPPETGILALALFIGKLIRILSTGSTTEMLADVRREFAEDFARLRDGCFWR